VSITLTEADGQELDRLLNRLQNEQLPVLLPNMARRTAKGILKDLKSRWAGEEAAQNADLAGFRERLGARWSKPLGQLRMLLTMIREWCQDIHRREDARKTHSRKQLRKILIRLLVRAIQVTDEILCLLGASPPQPVESSMLTIYTRHAGDCDYRDDMNWRRCRCPKWIRGVLPNGRNLRTAAKTRSWEQAEKYARKLEAENDPLQSEEDRSPVRSTIRDAAESQ
jgi:hypothetical protein